jgi:hypothetical protein
MTKAARSIIGKLPQFFACGKFETSQCVSDLIVSIEQIHLAATHGGTSIADADGAVQRTFGPSLGQLRNKPFSAEVLSLLGP